MYTVGLRVEGRTLILSSEERVRQAIERADLKPDSRVLVERDGIEVFVGRADDFEWLLDLFKAVEAQRLAALAPAPVAPKPVAPAPAPPPAPPVFADPEPQGDAEPQARPDPVPPAAPVAPVEPPRPAPPPPPPPAAPKPRPMAPEPSPADDAPKPRRDWAVLGLSVLILIGLVVVLALAAIGRGGANNPTSGIREQERSLREEETRRRLEEGLGGAQQGNAPVEPVAEPPVLDLETLVVPPPPPPPVYEPDYEPAPAYDDAPLDSDAIKQKDRDRSKDKDKDRDWAKKQDDED